MGVPRVLAAAPTGYFDQILGWGNFFIACAVIAVPGLLLLIKARSFGITDFKNDSANSF
jgi:PAT family beta-lactamase induction signal transducer AmpG